METGKESETSMRSLSGLKEVSSKTETPADGTPANGTPSFRTPSCLSSSKDKTAQEVETGEAEISAEGLEDWVEDMGDGPKKVCWQSMVPLLIGGMGSISAGLILNLASTKLERIKDIPQFIAVMPPIQGMKGNLDMTFTSRLSTMANGGELDNSDGRFQRIFRNFAVLQGQAALLALFAVFVSFLFDMSKRNPVTCAYEAFVYLTSVAQLAMIVSCFVMTSIMVTIVIITRKYKLNPDNMATPFASSLGDLLTIGLMLAFCYAIRWAVEESLWVSYTIISICAGVAPIWFWIAWKEPGARTALKSQWITLLLATIIGCLAGALLEWGEQKYPDITAYQPLISGIAGNRAALVASRMSSALNLHRVSSVPLSTRLNPFKYYFCTKTKESRTARMLLITSVAFQIIFVLISHGIAYFYNPLHMSSWIIIGYLVAAFLQVFLLVFLAQLVAFLLWKRNLDPDMHAIPILTAVGDVMGSSLLIALFHALDAMNKDAVRGGEHTHFDNSTISGCVSFG